MRKLSDYRGIAPQKNLAKIARLVKKLKNKHIVFVSSTHQAGGVAEMLNSMIPFINTLGIKLGWRILHGNHEFFLTTKKIHNALQSGKGTLNKRERKIYEETNQAYSIFTHLDHDLVVVHDPQPLPLRKFYKNHQPWILRLHIDLSSPNKDVWKYLRPQINLYDGVVISHESYLRKDIKPEQTVIHPAIDPLTVKNKPLSQNQINTHLAEYGINLKKPIVAQVSRFDKWKDPIGVLRVFEQVKKQVDCQLVMLGSLADDDPEGQKVFAQVQKIVQKSSYKKDIKLIMVSDELLVNAVQRSARVVVQKSIREGFGLVVAEALYKETPVVASDVGGICLQVQDGINGFLHPAGEVNGFSQSVVKLLRDKKLSKQFGRAGHGHIKENFLITRLIADWLELFSHYL